MHYIHCIYTGLRKSPAHNSGPEQVGDRVAIKVFTVWRPAWTSDRQLPAESPARVARLGHTKHVLHLLDDVPVGADGDGGLALLDLYGLVVILPSALHLPLAHLALPLPEKRRARELRSVTNMYATLLYLSSVILLDGTANA